MIVTFNPSTIDLNYSEGQNINLVISWTIILSPEELLEPILNSIVSKTIIITPVSTNINIIENIDNFTLTGTFSLDDFNANISYVTKGSSDKLETPILVNKYSAVPDMKDVFRIVPLETTKTFSLNVELKDKNNVLYNKTYNITIKLNDNSISNWTKNYFEERY